MNFFRELVIRIRESVGSSLGLDPSTLSRGESGRPVADESLESILREVDDAESTLPVEVTVTGR